MTKANVAASWHTVATDFCRCSQPTSVANFQYPRQDSNLRSRFRKLCIYWPESLVAVSFSIPPRILRPPLTASKRR